MKIYTIGFTKKRAEKFFSLLETHNIDILVDIRLKPNSQLSGFAKSADLPYFLSKLVNMQYMHLPELAPSEDLLTNYRKNKNWDLYEHGFETLMDLREIPTAEHKNLVRNQVICLLCSEHLPKKCHRRLIAERWGKVLGNVEIVHLT